MERNEWMNDQVRDEIEDLRQTHGLEGDEALAFWHLVQAGSLMNDIRRTDVLEKMDRYEGQDHQEMWQRAVFFDNTAQ